MDDPNSGPIFSIGRGREARDPGWQALRSSSAIFMLPFMIVIAAIVITAVALGTVIYFRETKADVPPAENVQHTPLPSPAAE